MVVDPVPTEVLPSAGSPIRKPAVYRLLIIALLAEIAYGVMNLSTMPVYLAGNPKLGPPWMPSGRGFGESIIGLVLVAFLLSEAVFKGPMGHMADRIGPKRLMMLGPALSVGTSILSLFVPHTGGAFEVLCFILLRAVDGLGAAMLWPAAFSAMGEAVSDSQRQQAMSLLNLCYMLGIALALPIGGIANDLAGVKWAGMVLAGALFTGVTLGTWRLIPAPSHVQTSAEHGEGFNIREFIASCRQIPTYLLLAVVTFTGIGFPMAIFKLFPIDEFGMSETQIGFLIFPGAIAMGIASVPMSKFGERLGRSRAVHFGMALCSIGLAVIALGAFFPFLRSPWVLAIGGLPVGIGFLLAIPAWMASVSDIDAKKRGANLGAVMTAQGLGAIIGAPIGSILYDKMQHVGLGADFGRYTPFVGCCICVTFGWLLSLRILREGHRPAVK
jgi:DHA1 family multidrug resistance protein-like MFS transporter